MESNDYYMLKGLIYNSNNDYVCDLLQDFIYKPCEHIHSIKKALPEENEFISEKEIVNQCQQLLTFLKNVEKNKIRIKFLSKKSLFENKEKKLKKMLSSVDFFINNTLADFKLYEETGFVNHQDILDNKLSIILHSNNDDVLNYFLEKTKENKNIQVNKSSMRNFIANLFDNVTASIRDYDKESLTRIAKIVNFFNEYNLLEYEQVKEAIKVSKDKFMGSGETKLVFRNMPEWKEAYLKNMDKIENIIMISCEKHALNSSPVFQSPVIKKSNRI